MQTELQFSLIYKLEDCNSVTHFCEMKWAVYVENKWAKPPKNAEIALVRRNMAPIWDLGTKKRFIELLGN